MVQIGTGLSDMMTNLIIHWDLKLDNVMIHFPNIKLALPSKEERIAFLKIIDLNLFEFEVKIWDFGYAKILKN